MERAAEPVREWTLTEVGPGIRTPDPGSGPWHLVFHVRVRPRDPPAVGVRLVYGRPGGDPVDGDPGRSLVREWSLVREPPARGRDWDVDAAAELVLAEYRRRSVPEPDPSLLRSHMGRAARAAVRAWMRSVAGQWADAIGSEEVSRIWGEEEVRRVMES